MDSRDDPSGADTPNPSFLSYKSADIYFIFSFVLDFCKPYAEVADRLCGCGRGWEMGSPENRKGRPPFLSIRRRRRLDGPPRQGKTEEEDPVIYIEPSLYKTFRPIQRALHTRDSHGIFDVELAAWMRVADNGAACATFRVSPRDRVDFLRIYDALSLSQRSFGSDSRMSYLTGEDDRHVDLYRTFARLVREELTAVNAGLPALHPMLKLQDEEVTNFYQDKEYVQNPYVLSVVELDTLYEHSPFAEQPAIDSLRNQELATILFRLVLPDDFESDLKRYIARTRIPYGFINEAGSLTNFAWDTNILMCFSQTSSLMACTDKEGVPARIIRNSLLDMLEILRARWHMSIIINAQLDHDLEDFKLQSTSDDNLRVLKRLIQRRKRFASFLHDPLPYSFEGGSVSRLSSHAAEEMRLDALREMTVQKLDTLDRLHADQMKFIQLDGLAERLSSLG